MISHSLDHQSNGPFPAVAAHSVASDLTVVDTNLSGQSTAPINLPDLKLPSRMKRRGRPKNSERTTALNLPKKSKSCIKFEQQPIFEREQRILSWIINDREVQLQPWSGRLILKEDHIEAVDLVNN